MSVKPAMPRAVSVFIGPALMQFKRVFLGPRSSASYRVLSSIDAFATPITL
jgi:hypothetical protein